MCIVQQSMLNLKKVCGSDTHTCVCMYGLFEDKTGYRIGCCVLVIVDFLQINILDYMYVCLLSFLVPSFFLRSPKNEKKQMKHRQWIQDKEECYKKKTKTNVCLYRVVQKKGDVVNVTTLNNVGWNYSQFSKQINVFLPQPFLRYILYARFQILQVEKIMVIHLLNFYI